MIKNDKISVTSLLFIIPTIILLELLLFQKNPFYEVTNIAHPLHYTDPHPNHNLNILLIKLHRLYRQHLHRLD